MAANLPGTERPRSHGFLNTLLMRGWLGFLPAAGGTTRPMRYIPIAFLALGTVVALYAVAMRYETRTRDFRIRRPRLMTEVHRPDTLERLSRWWRGR